MAAEPRSDTESDSEEYLSKEEESDEEQSLSSNSNDSSEDETLMGQEEPTSAWHNLPTNDLSLEDLIKMREKVGSKSFQKVITNSESWKYKGKKSISSSTMSKNKPQEMSSKIKTSSFRQVVNVSSGKTKTRDPRFDDLCGSNYDEEVFDKRFSFLQKVKDKELMILNKKLKKSKKS